MSRTLALGMIGALTGIGLCAQNAKADVPMAVAVEAAQTAVAACKANGYNVAATIMDADLSTRVVLRGDGAPDGTVEFGRRKAYTVIKTGMSSGEFGKTAPAPASPPASGPPLLPGTVAGDPNLISWAGGVAIKAGGKIIGALSVAGAPDGDKDEACANEGLGKIAGKLK